MGAQIQTESERLYHQQSASWPMIIYKDNKDYKKDFFSPWLFYDKFQIITV